MWCAVGNHDVQKDFLDSSFNYAVIDKILNFQEIAPNFTFSQKSYFLKYNWNFLDQMLLHYKLCGRYM